MVNTLIFQSHSRASPVTFAVELNHFTESGSYSLPIYQAEYNILHFIVRMNEDHGIHKNMLYGEPDRVSIKCGHH